MGIVVDRMVWEEIDPLGFLEIGCDGASKGNPGVGGYGWYHSKDLLGFGGVELATNNMMELEALRSLLEVVPGELALSLYLDSKYVIDSMSKYIFAWRRNGYITSTGKPVANKELIVEIDTRIRERKGEVKFNWVKGHNGHPLNEQADRLANKGAEEILKGRIRG